MAKHVGQSRKRVEDPRFLQGKGSYVANINLPNMAYAAILHSPYAHAKIKKIDTKKAKAMKGVLGVYTGQDLIDGGTGSLPSGWNNADQQNPTHYAITADKARHVGDNIAVVVAESPAEAQDAVNAIEVDYDVLPAVVDARKALEKDAPLLHDEFENNQSSQI